MPLGHYSLKTSWLPVIGAGQNIFAITQIGPEQQFFHLSQTDMRAVIGYMGLLQWNVSLVALCAIAQQPQNLVRIEISV